MSLKSLLERKDKEYNDLLVHMEELERRVKKLENFINELLSNNDVKQIAESEDAKENLKKEDAKLYLIQSELNENVTLGGAENYTTDDEFKDNSVSKYELEDCIKKEEFIPDVIIDDLFKKF